MASPSATVLCTAAGSFRLAPNMVVLFFLAAALLATPTRSSSPSSHGAGLQQPTLTLCSGHSPAVTSSEVTRFLAAVCAGAYGVAHMSHNMSSYVLPKNRNMYGVAQCRPDVSVSDCAACLAAASKLIAGTACAASAVWHDACFLRYSDHDPGRFREDEYTATVFNASRALLPHEGAKAEVRRLLATVANSTMSSHMCSSVGAGTGTASGGRIYGLTQCAAGISCDDCRRCLRGALEVVDRAYNGSAGMQVLRLSCMARYESYPFYNTESLALRLLAEATSGSSIIFPGATPAVPAPPGGRNPPPPSPPPVFRITGANTTVEFTPGGGAGAAQPTPAPPGGHTHMNLVRFLGYCFQEEGRFLIYEYVPNNSLDKFWYKASFQGEKLEWATWFNIILGVARGLLFLHDKGIIHRDLKPHNILLDDNFNPKIADFDLMRMYDKEKTHESTEKVAGTFGYMAPECTSGRKLLLSIKSDVYSYGVLVLEIITGHKIYTFEGQDSEGLVEYVWQHWTEKRGSDVVDGDLGVEGQEHAARQALRCVHVALLCVQSDRARRPTMGQVIAMLSSDDGAEELPEPSLPGYIVRPTAASGVQLCFGCR